MYLIGSFIGSTIAIFILSLVVERLAFKRKPPALRAQLTVGTSLIIASIIAGFGKTDGGPFIWSAGLIYMPGAVLVFVFRFNKYKKLWIETPEN